MTKKRLQPTEGQSATPLARGNRALRDGQYAEAIAHYENALKQAPKLKKTIAANLALAKKKTNETGTLKTESSARQVLISNKQSTTSLEINPDKKIAVVVHYFYPDIWIEIKDKLAALPSIFDLFVTVPIEIAETAIRDVLAVFPTARIHVGSNIGMDIVPFLSLIPTLSNEGYYAVCKLQTKKGDGHLAVIWRQVMLDSLIGSSQNFFCAIDAFLNNDSLCLIGPAALYQSGQRLMYDNAQNLSSLLDATYGSKLPEEDWGFFAGTMFWSRVDVLVKLAKLANFSHSSFDGEYKKDGKLEHALERFFGLLPVLHGGKIGLLQPKRGQHEQCEVLICDPKTSIGQAHIGDVMRQLAKIDNDREIINNSGYFSADYYISQNPELAGTSIDYVYHYLIQGCYRGNLPCHNFSTFDKISLFFKEKNDQRNPFLFYIEFQGDEFRISEHIKNNTSKSSTIFDKDTVRKSGLFDEEFYVCQYPKIHKSGEDPIDHYFEQGSISELYPNKYFIPREYRDLHGDVVKAGVEPFYHYLTAGALEGRRYRTSPWREEDETPFFRYMVLNATLIDWQELTSRKINSQFVSIVIPIYGQLELTKSCLNSILASRTNLKYEIICVDNGSGVETSKYISDISMRENRVRYVRNNENYNFAIGCNIGFQKACGEFIVFLNNDTTVTDGWLDELIQPLDNLNIVAVQPKLLYPDGSIQNIGVVFAPKQTLGYPIYANFSPDEPCVNISRNYQAITAACMAIRASDFAAVKGFDPLFINGQEDVDLCLRLTHGTDRMCRYQASSVVIHHESKTPGRGKYIKLNRKNFTERWRNRIEPDDYKYYSDDKFVIANWNKDSDEMVKAGIGISRPTLDKLKDTTKVSRLRFFLDNQIDHESKTNIHRIYANNANNFENILISIVMPTFNRAAIISKAIESVFQQTHQNFELHICDDGSTDTTGDVVSQYTKDPRVHYHKLERGGVSAARNKGLEMAKGELITYLDSDNTWNNQFLETMLTVIEMGQLDSAYCAIQAKDDQGKIICYRGDDFYWDECLKENYIDMNAFVHTRAQSMSIRFDESLKRLVDWDFILRLTKRARVCYVPYVGVNYYDGEQFTRITRNEYSGNKLTEMQAVIRAKHESNSDRLLDSFTESIKIESIFSSGLSSASNLASNNESPSVALVRLNFRIKIGCPNLSVSKEWGDYHFANAMKKSFEKSGHYCAVDCIDAWDTSESAKADIVIVLRGLSRYKPKPHQINLMWNISHPDKIMLDEYADYDHIFVASPGYAIRLQEKLSVPVSCLLQCTDPDLFNPTVAKSKKHDLLFVGNSRNIYRRIVSDAIKADLPISVYGTLWDQFISNHYISGEHINNEELASYYASAGIVLNDHWDTMHEYGFLSNRLFDAAACASLVISDDIEGLSDVFGSTVLTYKTPEQLRQLCFQAITEVDYEQRLKLSDLIIKNHSFDSRIKEILYFSFYLLGKKVLLYV